MQVMKKQPPSYDFWNVKIDKSSKRSSKPDPGLAKNTDMVKKWVVTR